MKHSYAICTETFNDSEAGNLYLNIITLQYNTKTGSGGESKMFISYLSIYGPEQ